MKLVGLVFFVLGLREMIRSIDGSFLHYILGGLLCLGGVMLVWTHLAH